MRQPNDQREIRVHERFDGDQPSGSLLQAPAKVSIQTTPTPWDL